jgi:hypothetical protein
MLRRGGIRGGGRRVGGVARSLRAVVVALAAGSRAAGVARARGVGARCCSGRRRRAGRDRGGAGRGSAASPGTLRPCGPHEALGVRVGLWRAERRLDHLDALGAEDLVDPATNFESRSRIRNLASSSAPERLRLRACWVTQRPEGRQYSCRARRSVWGAGQVHLQVTDRPALELSQEVRRPVAGGDPAWLGRVLGDGGWYFHVVAIVASVIRSRPRLEPAARGCRWGSRRARARTCYRQGRS